MKDKTSPLLKEKKLPTTKQFVIFYTVFFSCNLFIIIVLGAASHGAAWTEMFFHNGTATDLFMDFFNTIRDSAADNVYTERNNMYPPLCILLFRLFSKIINPELVGSGFNQRKLLQSDVASIMLYFVFVIICLLAMIRIVESYANNKSQGKMTLYASIISFLMIVSYPVVYCIERGNIVILAVVFSTFFLLFKDSENKVIRELSYISLALSAGIKLYPAIFGLTLIIEKKYKEAGRLILYGIIAVVFPLVFFIDFSSDAASISTQVFTALNINPTLLTSSTEESSSLIFKFINNLISFTNAKSNVNLSCVSIHNLVILIFGNDDILVQIVTIFTELIALLMAFTSKKEWQKIFFLTYLILNISSASSSYSLSLLIAAFIIFLFNTKSYNKRDWVYVVCFALLLVPLPTLWYFHPEIVENIFSYIGYTYNSKFNQCIGTLVFQFMFVFLTVDVLATLPRKSKKAKATASGNTSGLEIEKQDENTADNITVESVTAADTTVQALTDENMDESNTVSSTSEGDNEE